MQPLRVALILWVVFLLHPNPGGAFGQGRKDPGEQTVYVTATGQRYHREDCSSLRISKIPLTLRDAHTSGYGPCAICNPPALTLPAAPRNQDGLYRVNLENLRRSSDADISRMTQAVVVHHVDGDTVRVRIDNPPAGLNGVETIRMLGVDTPETVHPNRPVEAFGKEASDFTRRSLLNQTVYLAFDWDLRDRYGRLLAYIYTADGDCFNARLLREGYASAYTQSPIQFLEEFRALETQARSRRRGLWSNSTR
jgi:micrococcal nuclease